MISIIGLCGVARSGKDTFFDHAQKYLKETYNIVAARYAFADALKQDINKFLIDKTGITAYTARASEKKLIRPMLVAYGAMMREMTEGSYWVNNAKEDLDQNKYFDRVTFITDVRYENEYEMIKERGGICIHLKRIRPDLELVGYANDEEAKNDPIVESRAEERITWDTFGESSKPYLDIVQPYMDKYFSNNTTE